MVDRRECVRQAACGSEMGKQKRERRSLFGGSVWVSIGGSPGVAEGSLRGVPDLWV